MTRDSERKEITEALQAAREFVLDAYTRAGRSTVHSVLLKQIDKALETVGKMETSA